MERTENVQIHLSLSMPKDWDLEHDVQWQCQSLCLQLKRILLHGNTDDEDDDVGTTRVCM